MKELQFPSNEVKGDNPSSTFKISKDARKTGFGSSLNRQNSRQTWFANQEALSLHRICSRTYSDYRAMFPDKRSCPRQLTFRTSWAPIKLNGQKFKPARSPTTRSSGNECFLPSTYFESCLPAQERERGVYAAGQLLATTYAIDSMSKVAWPICNVQLFPTGVVFYGYQSCRIEDMVKKWLPPIAVGRLVVLADHPVDANSAAIVIDLAGSEEPT